MRNILKLFITLTAVLQIVACSTIQKDMNEVHVGMTKKDAVKVLGNPDTTEASKTNEKLYYSRTVAFGDKRDFFVSLTDGKVDSYGQVEQKPNPAALMLLSQRPQSVPRQQPMQVYQMPVQQTVHCTTSGIGNQAYTNCN